MKHRILLVEDDPQDASWIQGELQEKLNATVEVITSEREFVMLMPVLATQRPSLIIFDVMLRWARASEELEKEVEEGKVPKEVLREGTLRAGIRCVARLKQNEATRNIPFLIYTGLKTNNFGEENIVHIEEIITKSDDIRPLIDKAREKLARKKEG